VKPILESSDAFTLYKTPIIYGVCDLKEKRKLNLSKHFLISAVFGEFNSFSQQGTGGCFGSNDHFAIPLNQQGCVESDIQYHIKMLPPDEYVSDGIYFKNKKKFSSVYFEAKGNAPIYLGNFYTKIIKLENNAYPVYKIPVSSIKYNFNKARKALENLGVDSTYMKKVHYTPTNGRKNRFLCTP